MPFGFAGKELEIDLSNSFLKDHPIEINPSLIVINSMK